MRSPASRRCAPAASSSTGPRPGKVGVNDIGIEIEAGLAFGTGHHGTTRGCLMHFDRLLKRRRPRAVLDVGCGAGVLAIAAARVLKRQVRLGDLDPVAVTVANDNARLNGVGDSPRRLFRAASKSRPARAAPYDVVFTNILAKPLRLLASSLAAVTARTATPSSRDCSTPTAGVLAAWRAQGFFLPSGSTWKAGRASGSGGGEAH